MAGDTRAVGGLVRHGRPHPARDERGVWPCFGLWAPAGGVVVRWLWLWAGGWRDCVVYDVCCGGRLSPSDTRIAASEAVVGLRRPPTLTLSHHRYVSGDCDPKDPEQCRRIFRTQGYIEPYGALFSLCRGLAWQGRDVSVNTIWMDGCLVVDLQQSSTAAII